MAHPKAAPLESLEPLRPSDSLVVRHLAWPPGKAEALASERSEQSELAQPWKPSEPSEPSESTSSCSASPRSERGDEPQFLTFVPGRGHPRLVVVRRSSGCEIPSDYTAFVDLYLQVLLDSAAVALGSHAVRAGDVLRL